LASGIGAFAATTSTVSIALLVFLPREYTQGDIGISAAAVLALLVLLFASFAARRSKA